MFHENPYHDSLVKGIDKLQKLLEEGFTIKNGSQLLNPKGELVLSALSLQTIIAVIANRPIEWLLKSELGKALDKLKELTKTGAIRYIADGDFWEISDFYSDGLGHIKDLEKKLTE